MKKTLLSSIVLLFSVATFAQTSVKSKSDVKNKTSVKSHKNESEVNHSGSASSTATIQADDVKNTEKKSSERNIKGKIASEAKKGNASDKAQGVGLNEMWSSTNSNKDADASEQSSTSVNLLKTNNKSGEKTSIKAKGSISEKGIKSNEDQLDSDEKILVKTKTHDIKEGSSKAESKLNKKMIHAEKKINKNGSASINAGGAASNNIHVKPVSVKTGANIHTKAGIKIK